MPKKYKTKRYKPSTITGIHVVAMVFGVGMMGLFLLFYLIGISTI